MLNLSALMIVLIVLVSMENQVQGRPNGDKCRKDSQCDSGNCCGVWPFKRCRECCKDSDCPSGQNCKYVCSLIFITAFNVIIKDIIFQLIPNFMFFTCINNRNRSCIAPRTNGQSCVPDSDCASGHCCGVWPFKRCRECCKDSHCSGGKFCRNRSCQDCLAANGSGCSSDDHCCGQLSCCGEKKFLGMVLTKGTCKDPNLPCCALPQQTCSTSPVAPETLKCCSGVCQEIPFGGGFVCV